MDDLISRKAAVKIAERYSISKGTTIGKHSGTAEIIADEIKNLPSVDAVPLDKLCEMLGTNSACPQNNNHEYCLTARCELCWKDYLTKWMEEQNAAD